MIVHLQNIFFLLPYVLVQLDGLLSTSGSDSLNKQITKVCFPSAWQAAMILCLQQRVVDTNLTNGAQDENMWCQISSAYVAWAMMETTHISGESIWHANVLASLVWRGTISGCLVPWSLFLFFVSIICCVNVHTSSSTEWHYNTVSSNHPLNNCPCCSIKTVCSVILLLFLLSKFFGLYRKQLSEWTACIVVPFRRRLNITQKAPVCWAC